MTLYTAQYRYQGKDRLDITVKGKDIIGRCFAPTWEMVNWYKTGTINSLVYTGKYYHLLAEREKTQEFDFINVVCKFATELQGTIYIPPRDVTLVCFCPADTFCHRHLLVKWLIHNWPKIEYGGERR